jgi:membrane protease YdiL (CAAX protease family)
MFDPPISYAPAVPPEPPLREPYWTPGTIVAWLIILCALAGHFAARAISRTDPELRSEKPDLQLQIAARQVVGMRHSFASSAGAQVDQQLGQLQRLADRPIDRLRVAMVIAELRGAAPALEFLGTLPRHDSPQIEQDIESLETLYTTGPESLEPERRQRLIDRHGWFGKLALGWGLSRDNPDRRAALRPAIRTAIGTLALGGVLLLLGIIGLALCVLGIVFFASGMLRFDYRAAMGGRNGVFLESFALYLGWMIGLSAALRAVFGPEGVSRWWSLVAALAPLACLWPLARGVRFAELCDGLGWHGGRGWLRETGIGIVGYLGGLPIVFIGILVTFFLSRSFGAEPTHPISREISADPLRVIALLLLASVYAPLAEETMFRGAFYHGTRWSLGRIGGMLIVSFIFAAIHPQGWTAVPALMCIALVFNLLREWRGSIVAPVVAHALNNGVIVALLVILVG